MQIIGLYLYANDALLVRNMRCEFKDPLMR